MSPDAGINKTPNPGRLLIAAIWRKRSDGRQDDNLYNLHQYLFGQVPNRNSQVASCSQVQGVADGSHTLRTPNVQIIHPNQHLKLGLVEG